MEPWCPWRLDVKIHIIAVLFRIDWGSQGVLGRSWGSAASSGATDGQEAIDFNQFEDSWERLFYVLNVFLECFLICDVVLLPRGS